jgi:hypothetical protein
MGQTPGANPSATITPQTGLAGTPEQQAAILAASSQSAGTTREALAESARQFNATLAQQQLMWQQQGLPELEIQQRTQALEDEQFRAQLSLAQQTQAQANAATVAGLTGYYNAPSTTPTGSAAQQMLYGQPVGAGGQGGAGAAGGGFTPSTQAQYLQARVQQLQGMGMSAAQAQQTATSEWSQGNAQTGNVAYGLPPGISFTAPAGAAGAQGAAGGWQAPTSAQWMAARVPQLQQNGMDAAQAAQTAQSEYAQGYAQSGNVAYGMPAGISFTPPPPSAAPGGTAGTGGTNGAPNGTSTPMGTQTLAGALQQANLSGMYNGAPTEAAREFNSTQGLNYLTTAASLGGPSNVFNAADFLRGAQSTGQMPAFLSALSGNTSLPSFQGAGNQAQTPQTMASLAAGLTGAPTKGSYVSPTDQITSQTLGGPGGGGLPSFQNAGAKTGPDYNTGAQLTPQTMGAFGGGLPSFGGAKTGPDYNTGAQITQQTMGGNFGAPPPGLAGVQNAMAGSNSYSTDQALQQIGSIFKAGPSQLAAGSIEKLTPSELAIFKAGGTKLGYSPDDWLKQYSSSGVGQSSGG